jgi:hypothetical protein
VSAVIFAWEPPVSADDAYFEGVVCRDFEVLEGVLEVDIVMRGWVYVKEDVESQVRPCRQTGMNS